MIPGSPYREFQEPEPLVVPSEWPTSVPEAEPAAPAPSVPTPEPVPA